MRKIEQLYNLYKNQPDITSVEAAELLNTSPSSIREYKMRLKRYGYLDKDVDGKTVILKAYRENIEAPDKTFKAQIYEEMLEIYMEDFRTQGTFNDRLAVGREIRLILEKI